uniref:Uncharacterized protein n=1 Tax=Rhizophora mucronata TaxID=61149 RepID=A0A2P2N9X2_RHIMU
MQKEKDLRRFCMGRDLLVFRGSWESARPSFFWNLPTGITRDTRWFYGLEGRAGILGKII